MEKKHVNGLQHQLVSRMNKQELKEQYLQDLLKVR
jgi:hypothetical protein